MRKKPTIKQSDQQLWERWNAHPELKQRFEAILALAEGEKAGEQTADEIEGLLIEEVRRLGAQTMGAWARGAHARIAAEVQAQNPGSYCGKKNG
jgi:hypothetical protein